MHRPVRIFVSYSHQEAVYLEPDSLLGVLRELTGEGVATGPRTSPFQLPARRQRGELLPSLAHPWAPAAPAFDPATAQQLAALTGGHPLFLQRVAFHRFETLADPQYDWRQAWEQML